MKIESIHLKDFKRFKNLTISGLPESAKLIVLVGPNGCGKSSVFDGIYGKTQYNATNSYGGIDGRYYDRRPEHSDFHHAIDSVDVTFHNKQPDNQTEWRKSVYARSAYRNDPVSSIGKIATLGPALEEVRIHKMIDNDQATGLNYTRLVSQALDDLFENAEGSMTVEKFREKILADIGDAILELFPTLKLYGLGKPSVKNATFLFNKGEINKFTYENLSGGEKAAFDLILDLVIKRREYDDTVFCIDEPESHIGLKIQQKLLRILYKLIPDNCQLWIGTHSIGMMRETYRLQCQEPDKVVFLNFHELDFDKPQEIKPAQMNRALWEKIHSVSLDDLADLVFPDTLYLCESTPEKSFDADCYNTIFSEKYPNVKFVSIGSKTDVKRIAVSFKKEMPNLNIIPVRDRDQMSEAEVKQDRSEGVKILSRTCIEKYLLDDEVLAAFCTKHNFPINVLNEIKKIRDTNKNEPKRTCQNIRTHLVNLNRSLQIGDNREAFLKYSLAPLLSSDMLVYKELKQDIFEE